MSRAPGIVVMIIGGLLAMAGRAEAQLLSPGELASAHAELSGLRQCAQCHKLGTRGVDSERCLECHTPLARRIDAGEGYHASIATDDCADCHQDHLGPDFDLVRLDTATFVHDDTGWALEGSHEATACRDCHEPGRVPDGVVREWMVEHAALDRTFLGLEATCEGCHVTEDPHGEAFGSRSCVGCHDAGVWSDPLAFDHGLTDFPLTGQHEVAGCADCHEPSPGQDARGAPGGTALAGATCAGCHDTPHGSAMSRTCDNCHETSGWHALRSGAIDSDFDHGRTGFSLRGAHGRADCASCHRPGRPPRSEQIHMTYRSGTAGNTYPVPIASQCASCHVDRHVFPSGAGRWVGCSDCHAESAWAPSSFGIAEHQSESGFPLTGAHQAIPCVACHRDEGRVDVFPLGLGTPGCAGCHEVVDDLHREAYADVACETCHVTDDFALADFPHPPESASSCATCHESDDPHGAQFADRSCGECHEVDAFTVNDFDHATTRFALDGAHASVDCRSCHLPTDPAGVVLYRPLGTECVDCHRGTP